MISAIKARGGCMPPMLIFPCKNFKDFLIKTPGGTLGGANPSGWLNENLFLELIKHFVKHTHSSKENPTILLFDKHESHISIPTIQLAKYNGIIMVTFHPQMQPLGRGIFGPFRTFYNNKMKGWMMKTGNPGKPAIIYNVVDIVGQVFS